MRFLNFIENKLVLLILCVALSKLVKINLNIAKPVRYESYLDNMASVYRLDSQQRGTLLLG